ncbi:hypothetical protein BDFB_005534 [Asbolus verrucosus]|uniref:Uncharacterized protein n=1 Tax=Asbolus verrucosus TaxID=1661398 RepID=A0A482WB03_ASBVE|nr:hypothetical protein BDFB_005534 [Asbolus verrucosus]
MGVARATLASSVNKRGRISAGDLKETDKTKRHNKATNWQRREGMSDVVRPGLGKHRTIEATAAAPPSAISRTTVQYASS